MLNHLSPRSIYVFYSFVIAANFVSSLKSNPWSSSVSSIKHNIIEPITNDSWQNSAMKTSCQSIIAHTSSFVLSIDTKWVVSIYLFVFLDNLQWNKHSWLQFVKWVWYFLDNRKQTLTENFHICYIAGFMAECDWLHFIKIVLIVALEHFLYYYTIVYTT